MFWLAQTRGTALVYPQAQLSTPNPPARGPAPGMSDQLGLSHSSRLPQRLIAHVQEDAAALRKFALQSDLHPSTKEANRQLLSASRLPWGSRACSSAASPYPRPSCTSSDRVACPDVLGALPTTPISSAAQVSSPQCSFAGLLPHIVAPCSEVHSPKHHQSKVLQHVTVTFPQRSLGSQSSSPASSPQPVRSHALQLSTASASALGSWAQQC